MAAAKRADWRITSGLIALAFVPVVAGAVRLAHLANLVDHGGALAQENARFFVAPIPVVLHIVSVTIYSLLGAFQFAPGFRRARPDWHRAAGCILVASGLAAALSGLWMAMFYKIVPADSANSSSDDMSCINPSEKPMACHVVTTRHVAAMSSQVDLSAGRARAHR